MSASYTEFDMNNKLTFEHIEPMSFTKKQGPVTLIDYHWVSVSTALKDDKELIYSKLKKVQHLVDDNINLEDYPLTNLIEVFYAAGAIDWNINGLIVKEDIYENVTIEPVGEVSYVVK